MEKNKSTARAAWKAVRMPYQQTEAYLFVNAIVDEREGKVSLAAGRGSNRQAL
jgi:putative iron-regulated protein